MSELPVIYAFARSGGTLVNRCLGAIHGNFVLSEVNPHGSVVSLATQARDWLHLITEQQFSTFSQRSYGEQVRYLFDAAQQRNAYLIIRDWTSVNFLNNTVPGGYLLPSQVLEQNIYLRRYGFTPRSVVVTRRAADVYESLTRSFEQFRSLPVEEFGAAYLAYAKQVCHYPIVHYEQICIDPEAKIREICNLLAVNYDPAFLTNFNSFDRCTGDNLLQHPSRGAQLDTIKPIKSNRESAFYIAASLNQACREVDNLFRYER